MKKMQRNEVHLWFVDDQLVTNTDLLLSYETLLSLDEKERMQRFIFPKHQHQFLLTRALVRTVLADILKVNDPAALVFEKNAYGKPSLVLEDGTTPLSFNLSHTDGLIVLAVMSNEVNVDLGIDVESLSRKAEILKLAERYFSAEETKALKSLDSSQHSKRFFDLWTLKESYIKACGKGLAIPLESFSFNFTGNDIGIAFSERLEDEPSLWRFSQFTLDEKYRVALALKGESVDDYQLSCKRGVPLEAYKKINP